MSTQTKHTPGPWQAMLSGNVVYEWTPPGGRSISCKIVARTTNHNAAPDTEEAANARLIAAAPELLEALKLAEERIVELSAWAKIEAEGQTIAEIRAAIAKAEGRAP